MHDKFGTHHSTKSTDRVLAGLQLTIIMSENSYSKIYVGVVIIMWRKFDVLLSL